MERRKSKRQNTNELSVRERAYRHIKKLVSEGVLGPGAGVSELVLAKELGSSRTPIREAMKQLDAEGLLEQNRNGGMVVAQLEREDIIELYELREALEVYSVGRVASFPLRPADRDRLQYMLDQLLVLKKELDERKLPELDEEQNRRFIESDLGFHALLMSMTGNSRIQKILHDTRLLIRVFAIRRRGHNAEHTREHSSISPAGSERRGGSGQRCSHEGDVCAHPGEPAGTSERIRPLAA